MSSSGWRLSGEVTEVVRTPHAPVVDDRSHREQKKRERREPPPSRNDDGPLPPDPAHGKIDILARPPA